jgi:hypothetical protein
MLLLSWSENIKFQYRVPTLFQIWNSRVFPVFKDIYIWEVMRYHCAIMNYNTANHPALLCFLQVVLQEHVLTLEFHIWKRVGTLYWNFIFSDQLNKSIVLSSPTVIKIIYFQISSIKALFFRLLQWFKFYIFRSTQLEPCSFVS